MSHQIEKPFDVVQSIAGTEWHGLADHVESITRETVSPMLFDIREAIDSKFILDDGTEVGAEVGKPLFADVRHRGLGLVPLSIMGEGYQKIPNVDLLESAERAFSDVGCKVRFSTAGTLDKLKKFFFSVELEGHEIFTAGGDKILSHINFITSHDGSYAVQAYDSNIRIVCMNTFRWSLDAAGQVGFTVKHTKNCRAQFENLELFLSEILNGRDILKDQLDILKDTFIDINTAEDFAKGYLAKVNKVKKGMELSTRSRNAALELVNLFQVGKGNSGESAFDLWNAGTEYWTSGEGVGRDNENSTREKRVCKSAFGMAAEHKDQWLKHITNAESFAETVKYGKAFKSVYA